MKNRLLLLSGALLVIVVLLAWPRGETVVPGAASPVDDTAPAAPSEGFAEAERERVQANTRPETSEVPDTPEPTGELRVVSGRVFDVTGRALSGIPVRAGDDVVGTSDVTGAFIVELRFDRRASLEAEGNGYAALLQSVVTPENYQREHVLISGPAIPVAGKVFDQDRMAVARARVGLYINDAVLRDFPLVLDMTSTASRTALSTEDGSFDLGTVPAIPGQFVTATRSGYDAGRVPAPEYATKTLEIILNAQDSPDELGVHGFVLFPDGRPAPGARVQFGFDETQTDDRGAFRLPLPRSAQPDQVLAAGLRDYGTAVMKWFGDLIQASAPNPPAPVTLVLRERPLNIAGTVLDAQGRPLEGWIVRISGGTAVTRGQTPPTLVEDFASGRMGKRPPTAEDGKFLLPDLQDREYSLFAYHRETLLSVITDPIRAGTEDARIVIQGGRFHDVVRGIVLSSRGLPQVGAKVTVGLVTHRTNGASSWESGQSAITDEGGRFELEDVPRDHVHLDVSGESVIPTRFQVAPDSPIADLRITAPSRCHFRVLVSGGDLEGLRFEIRDGDDQHQSIYKFQSGAWSSSSSREITEGQTRVYSVSELGVRLLVLRGAQVVAQEDILLSPDEVTQVRVQLRVP